MSRARPIRHRALLPKRARPGRAVVNAMRWLAGAATYQDLHAYRAYVINHEVGHGLGHPHRGCPAPGAPAPVMVQQTIGLQGCAPNPWPGVSA
jgi:hypothetical protein